MLKIKNNMLVCECGAAIENDDIIDSEGSIADEFIEETCYGHCIGCGKKYEYDLKLKFKLEQATIIQSKETDEED